MTRTRTRPSAIRRCPCGDHITWYFTGYGVQLPFEATLVLTDEDPHHRGWIAVRRPDISDSAVLLPLSATTGREREGMTSVALLHICPHHAETIKTVSDLTGAELWT